MADLLYHTQQQMPMILTSLRLAPNIERSWMDLQDKLFSRCGLVSARLLPPIIPLGFDSERDDESEPSGTLLERTRKRHPLTLNGVVDLPGNEEQSETRIYVPLEIDGFASLQAELYPDRVQQPGFVLAWEDPGSLADGERLEMMRILAHSNLPSLPRTQAFWLWAIRLIPGNDAKQWWVSAEWQELFYRRITVRYR